MDIITNMRSLMESIDGMVDDGVEFDVEEKVATPVELLGDIVSEIETLTSSVQAGTIQDESILTNDLHTILSSLKELNTPAEDEEVEVEVEEEQSIPVDQNGEQHYEDPNGSSFPAKHGLIS